MCFEDRGWPPHTGGSSTSYPRPCSFGRANLVETHVVFLAVALVAASLTAKRHHKPGLIRSPIQLI
jgi:hypothetical protein